MARKGGLTPMWSDREVERWFDYYVDRAEERIYKKDIDTFYDKVLEKNG